ncbi:MAG: virulence-associated E family protein [Leptospirillum sp.]
MAKKKGAREDGQHDTQGKSTIDSSDFLDPQVRSDGKRLESKIEVTPELIGQVVRELPEKLDSLHFTILRTDSSISPEVVTQRGYRSITADNLSFLRRLGFSEKHGAGLLIPVRGLDGKIVSCQIRFDRPVLHEDPKTGKKKKLRYVGPTGMDLRVDFPQRPLLEGEDIWIVEGMKKADSLRSRGIYAIAILGVWGALGKQGRKDFAKIDWQDRQAIIGFDSDVLTNPNVKKAESATAKMLQESGATVQVVRLPEAPNGTKVGVDDFLAQGGTLDDLMGLIEEPAPDWQGQLIWSETTGALKVNSANLTLILQHDDRFKNAGSVAYDEFTNTLLLDGKPLTDHLITEIGAGIELAWKTSAIPPSLLLNVLSMLGHRNSFHPVREWLQSLVWDKTPRVDSLFSRYFNSNDSEYVRACSRSFLIGAVARVMQPGCKHDLVPVLHSSQGTFKSTGLEALFGEAWTGVPSASFDTKDFLQSLHSGLWVIELAELSAMRRVEVEHVKKIISLTHDEFRPPYERTQNRHYRQCVFVATTNAPQFLKDPTGNRRFLPVPVGMADMAAIMADREQLFGEAFFRYRQGESWHTIPENAAELARESVFEVDSWEEKISPWLSTKSPQETTVSEILESCLEIPVERHNRADQMRVGAILKRLRWHVVRQPRAGVGRIRIYAPEQPEVVPEVVPGCASLVGVEREQPEQPKYSRTSLGLKNDDDDDDDVMKSVYRANREMDVPDVPVVPLDFPMEEVEP